MVTKLSVYFEEKTADSNAPVTVINGALVPGESDPRHPPPRLDVTIGMDQKLLAFVALGLTSPDGENITKNMADMKLDKLFWEKVHQSVFYLHCSGERGVCDTTGNTVLQVNRTVLLCVVVTNGDRTRGRIAVFACQRKGQRNEFRIAVMWRKEANCEELDQGYGSFIKAVVYLSKFNEKLHPHEKWKYMGPNCSKVTVDLNGVNSSFILRAYDNRARSTSRSPFLYKEWEMIKNETQRVLMVEDSGTGQSLEFRDQSDSNSMLFYDGEKRGKVEVIAIPFLEGSHGCYSIKAALSVAKFMEKMHSEGFVHGDIRGFNTVFSEDTGSLIDHDFGGKVDDVVFPNHYVQHLGDGRRPGCNGGESITADSDVKALVHVLFNLHVPVPFSEKSLIWYLGQQQITIDGIISVLESALKLGDVEVCPTEAYMSVLNA